MNEIMCEEAMAQKRKMSQNPYVGYRKQSGAEDDREVREGASSQERSKGKGDDSQSNISQKLMALCKGGGAPSSQGLRFKGRGQPSSSSKSGIQNFSHLGPRSVGNP